MLSIQVVEKNDFYCPEIMTQAQSQGKKSMLRTSHCKVKTYQQLDLATS